MRKYYKKIICKKGSVFIEFALIAPILLILIAAIIQFGFILNAKVAVNAASYEGARNATLSENPTEGALQAIQTYASATMPGWSYSERLKTEIDLTGSEPGDIVSVKVIYDIPIFFSKILPIGGGDFFSVSGSSQMKIEEKE